MILHSIKTRMVFSTVSIRNLDHMTANKLKHFSKTVVQVDIKCSIDIFYLNTGFRLLQPVYYVKAVWQIKITNVTIIIQFFALAIDVIVIKLTEIKS